MEITNYMTAVEKKIELSLERMVRNMAFPTHITKPEFQVLTERYI